MTGLKEPLMYLQQPIYWKFKGTCCKGGLQLNLVILLVILMNSSMQWKAGLTEVEGYSMTYFELRNFLSVCHRHTLSVLAEEEENAAVQR